MEHKYRIIRKHLDELGYAQTLEVVSLPLVEKLLSDLIHTTENLQQYKSLAEEAVKERDQLRVGIEPYKCDNAKLVRECNDLHLAFLQFKEQSEKIQRDLKSRVCSVEEEHSKCLTTIEKHKKRIKELELESTKKTARTASQHANKQQNKISKVKSKTCSSPSKSSHATTSLAADKVSHLNNEIKKLKDERLEQAAVLDAYVNQIKNRDAEIERLCCLLEGGRPLKAVHRDCCSATKDADIQIAHLTDEVSLLMREKKELDTQLKESIKKQHEAMKRALHLADRNRQLEKELRDIDQMALAVEAECNNNLRNNREKVVKLQHKMEGSNLLIQRLEKEVSDLGREKQELFTDVEALKLEKKHMESMLETVMMDKKQMTNRINQLTVIENDLNLEIDRLMQQTAMQKRKIVELECLIKSDKYQIPLNLSPSPPPAEPVSKRQTSKKASKKSGGASSKRKSPSPKRRTSSPVKNGEKNSLQNRGFSQDVVQLCMEKLQESFDKEREHLNQDVQELRKQVDYCKKHHKSKAVEIVCKYPGQEVLDKVAMIERKCQKCRCVISPQPTRETTRSPTTQNDVVNDMKRKLNENNCLIEDYQLQIRNLTREKHDLLNKLESMRSRTDWQTDSLTSRSTLQRLTRERDLAQCDVQRLEEERNMLRDKLKAVNDANMNDQSKMQNEIRSLEEQVHKLELERRQLIHKDGSKSADIGNLEEQFLNVQEQLKNTQSELTQQRTYSSQLKTLQEQTDRALEEAQMRLKKAEEGCRNAKCQNEMLEREIEVREQEVQSLKKDVTSMRGSLHQIDTERDGLLMTVDDKTEKMALLERELKAKEARIKHLEDIQANLQEKISAAMDENSTREHAIRTASSETSSLRRDLDTAMKTNENLKIENRRLQEELSMCMRNYKTISNDFEISKRQIDDLKRQLQQYVAEVKRAEDLISQKEIERAELLDHFKSLSQEATVLESNNNDLETEAAKSKIQLSVTLDHVSELEDKLHSQDTVIQSYESQISNLTTKVANLEMKIRQEIDDRRKVEEDLSGLRELCMKLDKQKDALVQQLQEKEDGRSQASRDLDRLRQEQDSLKNAVEKDSKTLASLEHLLAASRQETIDQRLLNDELIESVSKYKREVCELEQKLNDTLQQLDLYQEKALDYCQQVKLLRREIANEKYGNYKTESDFSKSMHVCRCNWRKRIAERIIGYVIDEVVSDEIAIAEIK